MQDYQNISIRSAASFRMEARRALRGQWKPALLIFFVLMLMTGSIISAGCTYSTSTEITPYWQLEASVGPFSSISLWRNGRLVSEYYNIEGYEYPILLPYSPLFVAAAALTALVFALLMPVAQIAQTRLGLTLLDGITPDFSLLHVSGRKYWLMVRTLLASFWYSFWPMLALCLVGAALVLITAEVSLLLLPLVAAGLVLAAVRSLSCSAAVYLAVSRESITAREAIKTSVQLMKGRRWRFVCLSLSFFGWFLLCGLLGATLSGIFSGTPMMAAVSLLLALAAVPLTLYMQTASIAFLRDADGRSTYQPINSYPTAAPAPSDESPADPQADAEQ